MNEPPEPPDTQKLRIGLAELANTPHNKRDEIWHNGADTFMLWAVDLIAAADAALARHQWGE